MTLRKDSPKKLMIIDNSDQVTSSLRVNTIRTEIQRRNYERRHQIPYHHLCIKLVNDDELNDFARILYQQLEKNAEYKEEVDVLV